MPRRFRRRFRRKRGSRKPKNVSWEKWTIAQVPKIFKTVRFLKSLVNVEKKFFDVAFSAQSVHFTTPIISDLTAIAQGDTFETRDGNKLRLKSIYVNLFFVLPDAANYAGMRVLILRDKQGSGTTPAASDILETTGSAAIVSSPLEKDVIARWDVVKDHQFTLDQYTKSSAFYKRFIKCSIPVSYQGTAATDVYTNALYILMTSSEATGANAPTVTGTVRMRFIDN